MAGKRGPSAMMRRSSSLRLVPSTSFCEHREERLERLQGRDVGRGRDPAHVLQDRRHGVAHQRLEQRLLVLEIEIERALGDAGARGHVVEPGGLEAVLGKDGEGGLQNRLAARLRGDLAGAGGLADGGLGRRRGLAGRPCA